MQEPKDGDFVAYIEALQRESAARLARQHASGVDAPFAQTAARAGLGSEASPTAGPPTAAAPAGFVRRDRDARFVRAIVAGIVGAAFLLSWLGDGGPLAFIIGVALLAYALPRVFAAFRASGQPITSRAMADRVFGPSRTPKGTRQ